MVYSKCQVKKVRLQFSLKVLILKPHWDEETTRFWTTVEHVFSVKVIVCHLMQNQRDILRLSVFFFFFAVSVHTREEDNIDLKFL